MVDNFEIALNHSAETATAQAKPIFRETVLNLTIQEALTLAASRQPDAATQLLRSGTEQERHRAILQPIVKQALDQTHATRLYAEMVNRYSKIPPMTPINAELTSYATQQPVNSLFSLIAQEEGRIWLCLAARGSEILKNVFGR